MRPNEENILIVVQPFQSSLYCRRRMEREAKAKVVTSVWGAEFVKLLAPLAVLPRSLWKNEMNSAVSSKSTEAKQQAWQGIEQNLPPPNGRDDLCLYFSLHPSSSMIKPLFQSTFYISIYLLLCILLCKDYLSIMCCTLIECIYMYSTNLLTRGTQLTEVLFS